MPYSIQSIVCGLLILCAAALSACSERDPQEGNELAQKREWSVVQMTELEYREKATNAHPLTLLNVANTEFNLVGIPMKGKASGYAWLIANPATSPSVKMMPENAPLRLSKQDIEQIEKTPKLSPEVRDFLRSQLGQ